MRGTSLGVVRVCVLCCVGIFVQMASAAPSKALSPAAIRAARISLTQTLRRHVRLVLGFERFLTTQLRRADNARALPVNVKQLTARLAASHTAEARLVNLETRLAAIPTVSDATTSELSSKITAQRAKAAELLAQLAGVVPGVPPAELAWWSNPPEPSPNQVVARPRTAAELSALLLSMPPGSFDELFGSVAGIDKQYLPKDK